MANPDDNYPDRNWVKQEISRVVREALVSERRRIYEYISIIPHRDGLINRDDLAEVFRQVTPDADAMQRAEAIPTDTESQEPQREKLETLLREARERQQLCTQRYEEKAAESQKWAVRAGEASRRAVDLTSRIFRFYDMFDDIAKNLSTLLVVCSNPSPDHNGEHALRRYCTGPVPVVRLVK